MSVSKRRALFERGLLNAREETTERAVRDHPAARRAFKRDVVFDDEPLVASTDLLNEAEVAEEEGLAQAPIAMCESNALGAVLSDPAIGDASGTAFVEFQSQVSGNDSVYDQANNNDLFFSLGLYQSAQDAPGC